MTRSDVAAGALVRRPETDSVSAWTTTNKQEHDTLPAELQTYVDTITGFKIRRSAPYTQAQNPAEATVGRIFDLMNVNLKLGSLSMQAWEDMLRAAVLQLNHTPVGASSDETKRNNTRTGNLFGRKPDLSRFIALPGQGVVIVVPGAKSNMGAVKAETGYYVGPSSSSSGWLVRRLRDRKLLVSFHINVVDDLAF